MDWVEKHALKHLVLRARLIFFPLLKAEEYFKLARSVFVGQGLKVWLTVYQELCKVLWGASLVLRKEENCYSLSNGENMTEHDQILEGEQSGQP